MKINIISISKFENDAQKILFNDYLKRMRGVELREIEFKKSKNLPSDLVKEQEAELILKALSKSSYVIAMDENGQQFKSLEFAKMLDSAATNGVSQTDFIIGGAYGLSQKILQRADKIISLGKLTLPHLLARIVLIEQIYRAKSISTGHPYHKE